MFMQRTASLTAVCGTLAAVGIFSAQSQGLSAGTFIATFQSASHLAHSVIALGFAVAPALMLCLVLLAAVPLIAIVAPIVFHVTRSEDATRRYRPKSDASIAAEISGDRARHPARAYLEIVGAENSQFAIVRDMLRIGREDDNDIRIPSKDVHRYHAAIYREHHDDWFVADLSGKGGNGVRVNGRVCLDARLKDGDIIEMGPGRLRFRAGPMSSVAPSDHTTRIAG